MKRTEDFEKYYNDILNAEYSVKNWGCRIENGYEDLWAVGFSADGQYVLTYTDYFREIWSVDNGEMIVYEELKDDTCYDEYLNFYDFTTQGFGPCEGERIHLSTKFGGGLLNISEDGYNLLAVNLVWPYQEILLFKDSYDYYCDKVCPINSTLIGYGFNSTGNAFVIAARDQLSVYVRL